MYSSTLASKMKEHNAKAYLVNTGWNGTGKRISLKQTRAIIDAIMDGSIDEAEGHELPIFGLDMPVELPGVDSHILDPRATYDNAAIWQEKADILAQQFIDNFVKYTDTKLGEDLVCFGPTLADNTID